MRVRAVLLCLVVAAAACSSASGGSDGGASCDPNPCRESGLGVCRTVDDGTIGCFCDPGTHDEGGACVPDTACVPTTCGGHGVCTDGGTGPSCACDPGYSGTYCEGCASGWFTDGKGGCTQDPCTPDPCGIDQVCSVAGGKATCACRAGTHDDGHGHCVVDQTCTATSCSGHGTCDDAGGAVTCHCTDGYAGVSCESCAPGWHGDGSGGCTQDPCTPNPCTEPHRSQCTAQAGQASCGCDAGYHLAGASCVPDESCTATSCSGHGACSVVGGVVQCACASGYAGAACDGCASGWHADGSGGCTQDPCTPNPCTQPNKTACTAMGTTAVCGCDAGYHSDGIGGCANDPCTPNPCAAQNQACRVVGGAAQCYTPPCDDGNPCTVDAVVGGQCTHSNASDGTACSTTLCKIGQTCTGGVCSGGTARVCNDGNPCTRDTCDAVKGCQAVNDDTLVPDDGLACTRDACAAGAASHTADDTVCDDGKWCDGTEKCAPGSGADARGCVATAVPQPPVLGANICSRYACSEASRSFVLVKATAGTACNDEDACTQSDQCRSDGSCAGAAVASCPAPVCSSTSSLPTVIDLAYGNVQGTVTMNGGALPATSTGGSTIGLYLVAHDTGAEHSIDSLTFQYDTGGNYRLYSQPTYATRLLPGVYDLWYERQYDASYNFVSATYATDSYVNGRRVLRRDVVIGTGVNVLDIDLPSATVQGTITMNGGALPATSTGGSTIGLYLVAQDTGAEHYIDSLTFQYDTGGNYKLYSQPSYSTRLLPGTYDLWYERQYDSKYNFVSATYATDNYVNGRRVLRKNVVIAAGANTIDIDLPSATVQGNITMNGGALPASSTGGSTIGLYLVAKDTGAEHYIDSLTFQYDTGGNYKLYSHPSYSTKLLPGTYDLWYERQYDSKYNFVSATYASDGYVNGRRILKRDVVIAQGANTLDVDLPSATVQGTITMNGATLPATSTGGSTIGLYLVSQDTGAEHYIDSLTFQYDTGGNYKLYSQPTYSTKLLPGTYDLWYERQYDSTYNFVSATYASDNYVNGRRVLRKNVVIAQGANTLDIDLPSATVNGTVTLNGGALPATSTGGSTIGLYLVAQDTGAEHYIDSLTFQYDTGGNYKLYSQPTYSTRLLPGTYDLWYERQYDSKYNFVSATYPTDNYANGRRVLVRNVVIAPGSNRLDIDLPVRSVGGSVTVDGGPPPTTSTGGSTIGLYLVARDTRAEHYIDSITFQYDTGGSYKLYGGTTFSTRLLPGTYDLWYERQYDAKYNFVSATYATDHYANGRRVLSMCLAVP